VRNIIALIIALAVVMTLVACSEARSPDANTSAPMAYEPSPKIARAPLSPPAGYPTLQNSQSASPHGDPLNDEPQPVGKWHASPLWSAVQGNGCIVVDQDTSAQGRVSYENCSNGQEADDQATDGGY
jgi:hypothetical protein